MRHGDTRAGGALGSAPHTERQLLDAAERAARDGGAGRALVLHLSRMPPPGPRPHHRRIARAVLEDAAQRVGGQVFALGNADLVLLLRSDAGLDSTREMLAELFRADRPDPTQLIGEWTFATESGALLAYARACLANPAPPPPRAEAPAATVGDVLQRTALTDLLQQQTAIRIGVRIAPIYREVALSRPVLAARVAALGAMSADADTLPHLRAAFDLRVLAALQQDVGCGGPLGAVPHGAALHVPLALDAALSDGFGRFADACRGAGVPVAVGIGLVEACADPTGFAQVQARLRAAGFGLVLDGVTPRGLLLTHLNALAPDLVKLTWSDAPCPDGVADAVAALGAARVVLTGAGSEAALSWGMALGIRRFQGPHVDAMLAAERLVACGPAPGCTLRQCTERAFATGVAGRVGCLNPALLLAALPEPVGVAA